MNDIQDAQELQDTQALQDAKDPQADDNFALPGFEPPAPQLGAALEPAAYRVLARKYRPRTFDDLIGQEAMVRTLANAFRAGRVPQAWMLTGVRGVGKTTTARILARALNYEPMEAGSPPGPTIDMPVLGRHCQAIMDSRHVDVLEMDAASNRGIDDIRSIIEGVRYAPVSARTKVYILDEVHMLTEPAFNALLKTLEEPPPHAKFVFATTEIRQVPVTILSRCQRFDLKRIDAGMLAAFLNRICEREGVAADTEALALIARAAEGSARDALSLLDQAIAHGAGAVGPDAVRAMLGTADRARIIDLFEAVMRGDLVPALAVLRDLWDGGADPALALSDLAEFTHLVTRLKIAPASAADAALTQAERERGLYLAGLLSIRVLSRQWQMLLKGIPEVESAPRPLPAAEMLLVRLAYAAELPTPDEALRALREGGDLPLPAPPAGGAPAPRGLPSPGPGAPRGIEASRPSPAAEARPAEPPRREPRASGGLSLAASAERGPHAEATPAPALPALKLDSFVDLVALAAEQRDIQLKIALERDVRPVRFEPAAGIMEFALTEGASRGLAAELSRKLQDWTGRRWMVALAPGGGEATISEQRIAAREAAETGVRADPLVKAVLERFPGAQIVSIRDAAPEAATPGHDDGEDASYTGADDGPYGDEDDED